MRLCTPFPAAPVSTRSPLVFNPVQPTLRIPAPAGFSVTGGVVYHGTRYPQMKGAYIFGDYITGRVIALRDKGQPLWTDELLAQEPGIAGVEAMIHATARPSLRILGRG